MNSDGPDDRPTILALAGSNGAGKTTFYETHLAGLCWPFVNADSLAKEFSLDPYSAADLAKQRRAEPVEQKVSFIFETVLSDPIGEKVRFLEEASITSREDAAEFKTSDSDSTRGSGLRKFRSQQTV